MFASCFLSLDAVYPWRKKLLNTCFTCMLIIPYESFFSVSRILVLLIRYIVSFLVFCIIHFNIFFLLIYEMPVSVLYRLYNGRRKRLITFNNYVWFSSVCRFFNVIVSNPPFREQLIKIRNLELIFVSHKNGFVTCFFLPTFVNLPM